LGVDANRPVIGVTPCSRTADYEESVRRAGGVPRVLSNTDDPATVLDEVDGILLTGGLDVDPARYDEPAHQTTEPAPDRDAFELPLSRLALAADVPVFAICRGIQVLNVAAGGTLIQDIPSQIPSTLEHSLDTSKDALAHDVRVTPGTRLFAALGTGVAGERCTVNSRHHQAVGRVADGFAVSAVSPDGVVEAIEKPDATFCVGVQWHPENFLQADEFRPLFESFVSAAREKRRSRS